MYLPLSPNQFLPGIAPGVFSPLGTLFFIAMLPPRTYPFRTVIQSSRFTRSLKYRQICPYSTTEKGPFPDIQKDGKDP